MDIVDRLRGKEITHSNTPYAEIAKEAAAEITRLRKERDEARLRFDQTDRIEGGACHAIRELLKAHGVPEAAFIDDFVGNAIAQRDEAREAVKLWHDAYATGRNEPLAIAKDATRAALPTPEAT